MERTAYKELEMHGKAYTFTISLYCTLMIWSAFMAIDRHAFSSAAALAPIAEKVEAQLQKSAATAPGGPAVLGSQPEAASSKKVVPVNVGVQSVSTFKQLVDIVVAKGMDGTYSSAFCRNIELSCVGDPWKVKVKGASNSTIQKSINVGPVSGRDVTVLVNAMKDQSSGELYISETDGTFVRGYKSSNHVVTRMGDAEARAGFTTERDFWMNRVSAQTAPATASSN